MGERHLPASVAAAGLVLLALTSVATRAQTNPAGIAWSDTGLRGGLTIGTRMVFDRSGIDNMGLEAGGTHTFEVIRATDTEIVVETVWEDPANEAMGSMDYFGQWGGAYYLLSTSDHEANVIGEEQVETPAGTLDTVVVEVTGKWDTKHTYYMVADQPGVYAKVVDESDGANIVLILKEVVKP